jgi:hypothetical protein
MEIQIATTTTTEGITMRAESKTQILVHYQGMLVIPGACASAMPTTEPTGQLLMRATEAPIRQLATHMSMKETIDSPTLTI